MESKISDDSTRVLAQCKSRGASASTESRMGLFSIVRPSR